MENDMIAKRVYVRECAGSRPVGRQWKMWIDTMKNCKKNGVFDFRQIRRKLVTGEISLP